MASKADDQIEANLLKNICIASSENLFYMFHVLVQ